MLLSVHVFECCWVFFLRLVSSFSPFWSTHMLDMVSVFLNFLRLVLCPIMWSCGLSLKMFHVHLKRMDTLLLWGESCCVYISIKSIWSRRLFSATVSLLILCLKDLPIADSGVLKSLRKTVLLLISFFELINGYFGGEELVLSRAVGSDRKPRGITCSSPALQQPPRPQASRESGREAHLCK